MKNYFLLFASLFVLGGKAFSQGPNCGSAQVLCNPNASFAALTSGSAQAGPDYGCLLTQPVPSWYVIAVQQSGTLALSIQSSAGVDIDFILWGPFSSPTGNCGNLTAANTLDCSYSTAAQEDIDVPNAVAGQFYVLLITNFSQSPTNISLTARAGNTAGLGGPLNITGPAGPFGTNSPPFTIQTSPAVTDPLVTGENFTGTGVTNSTTGQYNPGSAGPGNHTVTLTANSYGCPATATSVFSVCGITNITAGSPSACNPASNTYSVPITVTYSNPPTSGNLVVNGQNFPITTSPQTVTLTNVTATGSQVTVSANFSAITDCSRTASNLFTSPAPCACSITDLSPSGTHICSGATYSQNVVVTYSNPPASGSLTVNGQNFPVTSSPQTVTLAGLVPGTGSVNLTANFTAIPACTYSENGVFTAPTSCCSITALSAGAQTACNPSNNEYTQEVTVTFAGAPATGNLVVNGQSFPIGASPQTVTLLGLPANGNPVNVTANFSALASCTFSQTALFTAAAPCNCAITGIASSGTPACSGTTYSQDVVVSYANPPSSGNLVVNGQTFPITASPQTVTLSGLAPGTGAVNVIANFSANVPCTFTQNSVFTAPATCCSITGLAAGTQSVCNIATNTYSQEVTVTYSGAPVAGNLVVNGQTFAISGSPQTVSLTNLPATGNPVNVTANFSADAACTFTQNALFTSPIPCNCAITAISSSGTPACSGGVYSQNVVVTYSNAPSSGNLVVNGQTFAISGSPQTVTLAGLSPGTGPVSVSASFSATPSCAFTQAATFTAPASCCDISNLAAGPQTPCVSATNTYTQEVVVTFDGAPATGNLVVNGQSFSIGTSPQTVTLTNLTADGNPVNVSSSFSAEPTCSFTQNALFTSPASCACSITAINASGSTLCSGTTYSQNLIITYSNPPSTGSLVVNGQSFAVTSSPQTVTLTGLAPNTGSVNVTANFSAQPTCTFTQNNVFTAPAACCNITSAGLSNIICDNNGTTTTADDTYSFSLNPSGTGLATTYTISGGATGTASYGSSSAFGPFAAVLFPMNLTITDGASSSCTFLVTVNAPPASACDCPDADGDGICNSVDPCFGTSGIDVDIDGICDDIDCDDNDNTVGIPQAPGTPCNDGCPSTINDVISADGCTCEGTRVAPEIFYGPQAGNCTTPPTLTNLPPGYTVTYQYFIDRGQTVGTTGTGGVATYTIPIQNGDRGRVRFTIVTTCGYTDVLEVTYNCLTCNPASGNW